MNRVSFRNHFLGAFNTHSNVVELTISGVAEALVYWGDGERTHYSVNSSLTYSHTYQDNSLKTIRIMSNDKETITEIKLINASVTHVEYDLDWINQAIILNLGGNNINANELTNELLLSNNSLETRQVNLFGCPINEVTSTQIDDLVLAETNTNLTIYLSPQGVNSYENN